ncbi:MAG: dTMP kinase [Victivallaceae bacterium]|nr:dTMP kinase [Victivallaceae bacterium]
MKKTDFFITFEGPEGAGKSTQAQRLQRYFAERGIACVLTREPGGTPLAEELRKLLKGFEGGEKITPVTELLLINAARNQHMHNVILPALAAGKVVLCDRFSDSTVAYQGYGRDFDLEVVRKVNALGSAGRSPDLTFLIDLDYASSCSRTSQREETRGEFDRFEAEKKGFHDRVRQGYLAIARSEQLRMKVIDGNRCADEVFADILEEIHEHCQL